MQTLHYRHSGATTDAKMATLAAAHVRKSIAWRAAYRVAIAEAGVITHLVATLGGESTVAPM